MKISVHAAQRFLERVMSKVDYNHVDVNFAIKYLEKLLQDLIHRASTARFVLLGFENFRVIYKEKCCYYHNFKRRQICLIMS